MCLECNQANLHWNCVFKYSQLRPFSECMNYMMKWKVVSLRLNHSFFLFYGPVCVLTTVFLSLILFILLLYGLFICSMDQFYSPSFFWSEIEWMFMPFLVTTEKRCFSIRLRLGNEDKSNSEIIFSDTLKASWCSILIYFVLLF